MKKIKYALLLGLLGVVLVTLNACGSRAASLESQSAKVVRGNLTLKVNGSGKIEVSKEAKLSFGSGGKIDKINVKEGAEVKKGEALAKLETDSLELAVTQAEVTLAQAQLAHKTAEDELEQTQDIYADTEILQARQAVNTAQQYVLYAQSQLDKATLTYDITVWTNEIAYAKEKLRIAQSRLDNMLSAPDTRKVAIARLKLESARQSVKLAEQSLKQARKQLNEATIVAQFDGQVAKINAEEGEVIPTLTLTPKIIIHLIDTTSMELKIQVDEIDIPGVKLGQKAIIDVDALPTLQLEGKVSFISPLSVEEGGVLVYDVTIEFNVPANSGLRAGMSASADIITAERENVLVVPDRVITQDSEGNPVVEVQLDGKTIKKSIVTGISDGFQTEVVSGLEDGELVVRK